MQKHMFNSNKFIAGILLIAGSVACQSAPDSQDCARFQNGKFWLRSERDGSITEIYRNGKIQKEVKRGFDDTLYMAMIWMKDCRYDLQYLSGKQFGSDTISDATKMVPVKTKILSTTKDFYIFSASIEGYDLILKDTIFIMQ